MGNKNKTAAGLPPAHMSTSLTHATSALRIASSFCPSVKIWQSDQSAAMEDEEDEEKEQE